MDVRYRKILPYPPVKVSTKTIMRVCFSILGMKCPKRCPKLGFPYKFYGMIEVEAGMSYNIPARCHKECLENPQTLVLT